MGKNDITKEIENKIIELKENKNSVNKIIDNIFNEFNYKLTKYKVNKVISNHNTLQSEESEITEKTSNNNDEETNDEEDEETGNETEIEEEETKNNIVNLKNNSLINSLNNSKTDIKINENVINNNIPHPIPIINENKNDYIHDIINNTSNNNYSNIDDLKEKRHHIIIIRQYINTFPIELKNIFVNKDNFNKKLFNMTIDQLKLLLENIRVELNLKKNNTLFIDTCKNLLVGYEKVMLYANVDLKGIADELINDPNFMYDLQLISCEINISNYINPKTSCLIKLIQKSYMKYEENKIINNFENKLNNDDILNKIKNIQK